MVCGVSLFGSLSMRSVCARRLAVNRISEGTEQIRRSNSACNVKSDSEDCDKN